MPPLIMWLFHSAFSLSAHEIWSCSIVPQTHTFFPNIQWHNVWRYMSVLRRTLAFFSFFMPIAVHICSDILVCFMGQVTSYILPLVTYSSWHMIVRKLMNQGIQVFLWLVDRGRCLSIMQVCSLILGQPLYFISHLQYTLHMLTLCIFFQTWYTYISLLPTLNDVELFMNQYYHIIQWRLVQSLWIFSRTSILSNNVSILPWNHLKFSCIFPKVSLKYLKNLIFQEFS